MHSIQNREFVGAEICVGNGMFVPLFRPYKLPTQGPMDRIVRTIYEQVWRPSMEHARSRGHAHVEWSCGSCGSCLSREFYAAVERLLRTLRVPYCPVKIVGTDTRPERIIMRVAL